MKEPLISVVINCYNGERFLKDAIDSVYAQTYRNWEIIFWDNGSTDGSAVIAKNYNSRLKYFLSEKNTGLGKARKMAISQASGEYVAFLDCDDYWYSDKLQLQVPLFNNLKVGLVYSNYLIDRFGKKKVSSGKYLPNGNILDDLLDRYSVGFLTVIIRKDILFDRDMCIDDRYDIIHDFDLIIRIASEYRLECVQDVLACYRHHDDSETAKKLDIQISELESWLVENGKNCKISSSKNFYRQKDVSMYLKGLTLIYKQRNLRALRYFFELSFCVEKIKLFILIFVPKFVILHFK